VDLGDIPSGLGAPFEIAFLDPPYHKDLVVPCLDSLRRGGWLAETALVIVETAADETLDFADWTLLAEREIAAARFWFLSAD
ncbi:MAG: RsmD family RNA methyltransferase, partial [Pseudomonadota bacterium]